MSFPQEAEQHSFLTRCFAIITLAHWQFRQSWRLLLLTGISMTIAIALACAIPLFSLVTLTVSIQPETNSTNSTNFIDRESTPPIHMIFPALSASSLPASD